MATDGETGPTDTTDGVAAAEPRAAEPRATETTDEVVTTEPQPTETTDEVVTTEPRPPDENDEVVETKTRPTNDEITETGTQPTDTSAEAEQTERRPDLVWDADARGLCVRVYGDGVKSFIFVYRLNDRQHFIRSGTTPVWSLEAAGVRQGNCAPFSIRAHGTNKIMSRPSRTSSDTLPSNCKVTTLLRSISRECALISLLFVFGFQHFA
jgi:hypothetical protein